jgi:hypothetical protein
VCTEVCLSYDDNKNIERNPKRKAQTNQTQCWFLDNTIAPPVGWAVRYACGAQKMRRGYTLDVINVRNNMVNADRAKRKET